MRKYFLIFIVNLILIFLQESFLSEIFGPFLNPSLVISLGYAFLLSEDDDLALFSLLVGGLILDLLGTGIIGLSSVVLVFLLLISFQVRKTIFRGVLTQIVFIIITTVIFKMISGYPPLVYNFKLILSGVANAALAVFAAQILTRFKKRYLSLEFRIKA
jgi:hypothetical protein